MTTVVTATMAVTVFLFRFFIFPCARENRHFVPDPWKIRTLDRTEKSLLH
jgi:hypothetical protein